MLRSRVMLAVIGLLLIGGTSASIAVLTANHPGSTVPGTAQGNPTAPDGTATSTSGTPTATPLISSSPTDAPPTQPVPTATQPGALPTATPRIAPPSGQSLDLQGKITAVNQSNSTFTFRDNTGAVWTVQADPNTVYSGVAKSFADLRPDTNAEIHGQTTGGFNQLATEVNTQADN
ncbi:MAG TPA: hypothetical protein VFU88_03190 [Ktedonobacterales bacterium]|nr:hypothetical protein [Ktedonobacterales bacterium]